MQLKTIRIKSTHPASQGDFVEINETDYDPSKHELFDKAPVSPFDKLTVAELKAALTEKGITFDDKAKKPELLALLEAAE